MKQASSIGGMVQMRNRLLLSLLISGVLLYYALPNLSIKAAGLEGIFAITWLGFAIIVISGNLVGLFYSPKKKRKNRTAVRKIQQSNKRTRQYQ